jgi:hypothetical protein
MPFSLGRHEDDDDEGNVDDDDVEDEGKVGMVGKKSEPRSFLSAGEGAARSSQCSTYILSLSNRYSVDS